jgi:unsaturated chondroitin disaccharide hydrolase
MVRPDGGTFHVVDYDDAGHIRSRETFQGHSDPSTWSRGHAWAIYGFTMAYRYTKDPRMLEAARKVTDYYLDRLPPDSIPYWDMDAPADQQVKDSSAAAAVASALLELHTYVTDAAVKERYHSAALAMLDSLSSPAYLAVGTQSPGLLLHGVAFYRTPIKPKGEAIDESLIYGDYYFVEALLRFKQSIAVPSPVPPAAPMPPPQPEARGDDDGQGGCASAAPGSTMSAVGLLLWLLVTRRKAATRAEAR